MNWSMEDAVVHSLGEQGALGFETVALDRNRIRLTAYFQQEYMETIKTSLSVLVEKLSMCFQVEVEAPSIEYFPSVDWAEDWKKFFHPFKVSNRFVICPRWETCIAQPGESVIVMDPGQAFGTGLHESTRLCMQEIELRVKKGMRVLDIGCGSGILSVASAILGASICISMDNDPVACRITRENALYNNVGFTVHTVCADALNWLPEHDFDLVMANMLPVTLQPLLPSLLTYKRKSTAIILSGIPVGEEKPLLYAAKSLGFENIHHKTYKNWGILIFSAENKNTIQ